MTLSGTSAKNQIFEALKSTTTNLLSFWHNKDNHFVDKNALTEPGIISTSMGTTSLLLIVAAFGKNENIYDATTFEDLQKVVETSINEIYDAVENEGFTAAPFIDPERSKDLFNKERGYTDSVTWVVSLCALACYAKRKKYLQFSDAVNDKIMKLYARSLKMLLDAQHDDGMWGFLTDKECVSALYFTYSASTCLADVFDYTLGEIQDVEKSDDPSANGSDKTVIAYLNKNCYPDIVARLTATRQKTVNWLLTKCLAFLPQIANCKDLDEAAAGELGIWRSSTTSTFGVNYYYLYYTYYLIDLIVQTGTDLRFMDIVSAGGSDLAALKAVFKEKLSPYDYSYYFGSDKHIANFIPDYIEQSTHASRFHMSAAMRTGALFWDVKKSELEILWHHSDPDIEQLIRMIVDNTLSKVSDPVLVPMALRANAQFTYFISRQSDIALDKLFNEIINNRSENDSRNCIANMWDGLSYSLAITERSIEAIVDYYDYVCEYGSAADAAESDAAMVAGQATESARCGSEIDAAIENTINRILDEKLQTLRITASETTAKSPESLAEALPSLTKYLSNLAQEVNARSKTVTSEDDDDIDKVVNALIKLFKELQLYTTRKDFADICAQNDKNLSPEEAITKMLLLFPIYDEKLQALKATVIDDIDKDPALCNLSQLYIKLKLTSYR